MEPSFASPLFRKEFSLQSHFIVIIISSLRGSAHGRMTEKTSTGEFLTHKRRRCRKRGHP